LKRNFVRREGEGNVIERVRTANIGEIDMRKAGVA